MANGRRPRRWARAGPSVSGGPDDDVGVAVEVASDEVAGGAPTESAWRAKSPGDRVAGIFTADWTLHEGDPEQTLGILAAHPCDQITEQLRGGCGVLEVGDKERSVSVLLR